METIVFLLSYITPYIAVIVFVGGIAYRVRRWGQKGPVTAHLSLFPRPEGRFGRLADTLVDTFSGRGLLRTHRWLWIGSIVMHLGLLLLLLGHVRVVTDYYFLWDLLGWGEEQQYQF